MFQYYAKTSISLPNKLAVRLRAAMMTTKYPMEKLIFTCLHKYFKRLAPQELRFPRATIVYNRTEPCNARIYLVLNYDQQMTMRYYRMTTGKSASFMIYLALCNYLNAILRILSPRMQHNYAVHRILMTIYWENFRKFHLKIKANHRQILVATCILPKIRQIDQFSLTQIKVTRKFNRK